MFLGQSQPPVSQSDSSICLNPPPTTSSAPPVSNMSSFEQFRAKQNDLELTNLRVLPQLQAQQNKQHLKFTPPLKDNLASLHNPTFSQIVQRIRPVIIKKIKEIMEKKNKKKQMLCQRRQQFCGRYGLTNNSTWENDCNPIQPNPIKRRRQVMFSQVIAVKRFISGESPSIVQIAVEYHQGLNVKQKDEAGSSSFQQQNNQPSASRKSYKARRKVTKKMVDQQK